MSIAVDTETVPETSKLSSFRIPKPNITPRAMSVPVNIKVKPELLGSGGMRFRHYYVSAHALDRYTQRCGRLAREAISDLSEATLAYAHLSRSNVVKQIIRNAESRDGYVLFNRGLYFIVKVDECTGMHVVLTVIAPGMRFKNV